MMVGNEPENAVDDVVIVPRLISTANARGLVHGNYLSGKNCCELAHLKLLDGERAPGAECGSLPVSKSCAYASQVPSIVRTVSIFGFTVGAGSRGYPGNS